MDKISQEGGSYGLWYNVDKMCKAKTLGMLYL